jgi:carboxypeptidase T
MKMLLKRCFFLLIALAFFSKNSSSQEKYSRVQIDLKSKSLLEVARLGITTDHGKHKTNTFFETDLSASEINLLHNNGFSYTVTIDNVQEYYVSNSKNAAKPISTNCNPASQINLTDPVGFQLGTYAGYFTYQEMLDKLDSLATHYPSIFSTKRVINDTINSIEGRPIYYVVISDFPDSIEANEPEMLFNSVHHAREPGSLSQLLFFMTYLCENYTSNSEIQTIINNTSLYFIPCLNPDGYIYNQTTNPDGGGMWRKNRRDNGDGTFGVDLNRNYGHFWGIDDNGSSPMTNSDVYRGPAPFSEPETRAIRYLCSTHNFKMAMNNHTFGNLLIYPWGYLPDFYTPDSALFVRMSQNMTEQNNYVFGTGNQTVGYLVNGCSDDWMYGEQIEKPKILSWTPEAGDADFGFWPPEEEILPFCREMLDMNLRTIKMLLNAAVIKNRSLLTAQNTNDWAKYTYYKLGLTSVGSYIASVEPLSSNVLPVSVTREYSDLLLANDLIDSIPIQLSQTISIGDSFSYVIKITNNGVSFTDTVVRYFGVPTSVFNEDGNTINNWTSQDLWNTTSQQFVSNPSSITDSPDGFYSNFTNQSITTINGITLQNASFAQLTFYAKWDIENNWDFVQLQLSTDSGFTWIPLCGEYTNNGNANQLLDQPLYDGTQLNWVKETINLNTYLGQRVWFRFILVSDEAVTADGFYFDDFEVNVIEDSLTSLIDKNDKLAFRIIPNPSNEYFYLSGKFQSGSTAVVSIYDVYGKLVKSQTFFGNINTIKITTEELQMGTYFVRVRNGNYTSATQKLVILR